MKSCIWLHQSSSIDWSADRHLVPTKLCLFLFALNWATVPVYSAESIIHLVTNKTTLYTQSPYLLNKENNWQSIQLEMIWVNNNRGYIGILSVSNNVSKHQQVEKSLILSCCFFHLLKWASMLVYMWIGD